MKKTLATIIGVCSLAAYANAQGTFILDTSANTGTSSSAATGGLVWLDANGGSVSDAVLDTGTDISVALLWGTSAGTLDQTMNLDPLSLNNPASTSWLASKPTGASDITFLGNGTIVDPNGNSYVVPGQAAGNVIFMMVQGWTGSSTTYAGVTGADLRGSTGVFSITLAANSTPTQPDTHGMSALVLQPVPEPGTFALAGLGAAALMIFRRRK